MCSNWNTIPKKTEKKQVIAIVWSTLCEFLLTEVAFTVVLVVRVIVASALSVWFDLGSIHSVGVVLRSSLSVWVCVILVTV